MSALSRAEYNQMKSAYSDIFASSADAVSVAELHSLVKEYDKKFAPKPVNPVLLNQYCNRIAYGVNLKNKGFTARTSDVSRK